MKQSPINPSPTTTDFKVEAKNSAIMMLKLDKNFFKTCYKCITFTKYILDAKLALW